MKKSALEVADMLDEIAGHIRVTGRLDSLKQKELTVLVQDLTQDASAADYFSPAELESISKLSPTERMKIANRLGERNAKKSAPLEAA